MWRGDRAHLALALAARSPPGAVAAPARAGLLDLVSVGQAGIVRDSGGASAGGEVEEDRGLSDGRLPVHAGLHHEQPAVKTLPRPSRIDALKTSRRSGSWLCRSKNTAPALEVAPAPVHDVLAHRLEQRMARRDPLQRRVLLRAVPCRRRSCRTPARACRTAAPAARRSARGCAAPGRAGRRGVLGSIWLGLTRRQAGRPGRRSPRSPRAPAAAPWPRPTCRRWPRGSAPAWPALPASTR